jgi:hypothetical protein
VSSLLRVRDALDAVFRLSFSTHCAHGADGVRSLEDENGAETKWKERQRSPIWGRA